MKELFDEEKFHLIRNAGKMDSLINFIRSEILRNRREAREDMSEKLIDECVREMEMEWGSNAVRIIADDLNKADEEALNERD